MVLFVWPLSDCSPGLVLRRFGSICPMIREPANTARISLVHLEVLCLASPLRPALPTR
jgi:hypothetical protein